MLDIIYNIIKTRINLNIEISYTICFIGYPLSNTYQSTIANDNTNASKHTFKNNLKISELKEGIGINHCNKN